MEEIVFNLPNIADGEDKSSPLANRLRNNYRHIRKWAKRTNTNCFRVYDREMSYYPLAIDFYDGRFCIHYFASLHESNEAPSKLVDQVLASLKIVFGEMSNNVYWRTRSKNKETRQYEKTDESEDFFTVLEYGVKFKVNLRDYIDTGLFLDHRETRQIVAKMAKGKRVLNLFAYTCAFSVQAAIAGAAFTKSVDMSNTYTAWGRENFIINGLSKANNEIVRADCLKFLNDEICSGETYDIIVIDPPTISRSKKMSQMFNVQLDYIDLIHKALKLLSPNGCIIFSTNSRKFAFDESQFENCKIKEISYKTIPIDFHNQKIHRCWEINLR